jgi:hypothetical protein
MIIDRIPLVTGTGLNWDDDLSVMPKGDGKYRLNISLDKSERGGIYTKTLGNSLIKNIIDPLGGQYEPTPTNGTSPARKIYSLNIANYCLYNEGTYDTAGVIINIETDNGRHKIYHKHSDFTTLVSALSSITGKITGLGDNFIYSVTSTQSALTSEIIVSILDTSETNGAQRLGFIYGDHGTYNNYFTYKDIVGEYYYAKDNELYCFWSYDSNGSVSPWSDNIITVYKYNEGLSEVLNSTSLSIPSTIAKWNKYNPVMATVIGDGDDKMLYWTDGINPIMKLNVNKAINTAYDYYGDQYSVHSSDTHRNFTLSYIKPQPDIIENTISGLSSENESNVDIIKRPCHFIARYIFDDNEKSAWSTISRIGDSYNESPDGSLYTGINKFGHLPKLDDVGLNTVSKVEFAYRNSILDHWKLYATIDVADEYCRFDGSTIVEVLDDSIVNKLYDNVPVKSGDILCLPDNRILLADNTMGYPNVDVDVTLTHITSSSPRSDYASAAWDGCSYYPAATVNATTKRLYFISGTTNYFVIETSLQKHIINLSEITTLADYITNKIIPIDGNIVSATYNVSGYVDIVHQAGTWIGGYSVNYSFYVKLGTMKNGAKHWLGIVYYDQFGRMGFVNETDGVYLSHYCEQSTHTTNEYFDIVQLEISNDPPKWAHYWGVFYGLTNIQSYTKTLVKVSDFKREDGLLYIKHDDLMFQAKDNNPNFNMTYQFTKGDRIRWIGTLGSAVVDGSEVRPQVTLLSDYLDYEIQGLGGDYNEYLVVPDYSGNTSATNIDAADYVLIELYTPIKQDKPGIYYETPYKFPISNPGSDSPYHSVTQSSEYGVPVRSQSALQSAICYIDEMEFTICQHFTFDADKPIVCYMESESHSNYFDSKIKNIGRPHIANPDARQIRLNNILWSNVFLPNTRVNGLSTIDFDNEISVPDIYGRITRIGLTGDVLNIIQESKISSAYLGAEMAMGADGQSTVSYTDSVIGSIRPRSEPYGSSDKKSIVFNGNYIYGFDMQSGIVWRTAYNGTEDISRYKMKNYFRPKAETLLGSGKENILVRAGFDSYKKMYYLTFIDNLTSANSETIGFHEPSNRWLSFYSFIPEMYASIEDIRFISIKDGYLYYHDSTAADYGNFYGTDYGSEIWVVGNEYPSDEKMFLAIYENSNVIWDMPDNDSIVVNDDDIEFISTKDYTRRYMRMYSRLKARRFRRRKGEFHAKFLYDITTTTGITRHIDLFQGRKLRGNTIVCKLENDDNVAAHIRNVTIVSTPSP